MADLVECKLSMDAMTPAGYKHFKGQKDGINQQLEQIQEMVSWNRKGGHWLSQIQAEEETTRDNKKVEVGNALLIVL